MRVEFQVGQDRFEVGGDDLQDGDAAVGEGVDEAWDVHDCVLVDEVGAAADEEGGDQLPQGDVEALGCGLGDDLSFGDAQVGDLGVQVVEESGVFAHRALGLPGGAAGEVDVRELAGADRDAQVIGCVAAVAGGVDVERADVGQGGQGRVEGAGAAAFGQHEPALGAGEHGGDAVGREVRLDGEVDAAGLEDGQHGGHPVQCAFRDDGDHVLAGQSPVQQGAPQAVGPFVELPVGPPLGAVHGGDGVRMGAHPLLEQFVEAPVGHLALGSGQPVELVTAFGVGEQGPPLVLGVRIRREPGQCRAVVAGYSGRGVRVQHVGAVPQPQGEPPTGPPRRHSQHCAVGQLAAGVGEVQFGLERRPLRARFDLQGMHRPCGLPGQFPPGAGCGGHPAGQRRTAVGGTEPGGDVRFPRQRGEHRGVRGQQHRCQGHAVRAGPLLQPCHQRFGQEQFVIGEAGLRSGGPSGDHGESCAGRGGAPALAVIVLRCLHRTSLAGSGRGVPVGGSARCAGGALRCGPVAAGRCGAPSARGGLGDGRAVVRGTR
ncbi:hypothetical protein P354_37425 [Streptomyces noursei PD-1]|nr:hypothetical protein P354_37425 [Streptomyces noursei PD-1]